MALIKCPECGHDVSDKAVKCPKCGYPLKSKNKKLNVLNLNDIIHHKKILIIVPIIIVVISLMAILMTVVLKNRINVEELSIAKWRLINDGSVLNAYEATITSNEQNMFIAVIGEDHGLWISPHFVLMEDGKGTMNSYTYENDDPSSLYHPIGYIVGEKVDKSDFSSIHYEDTDYYDYVSDTSCYIDIDVEMKKKLNGFLWVEMSNDMTDEIVHNIQIPIVDGKGSYNQSLDELPLKSRGVEVTITPKYFCSSTEINEDDYEVSTQFSTEKSTDSLGIMYDGTEGLWLNDYENGIIIYTAELQNGFLNDREVQRLYQSIDDHSCTLRTYLKIYDEDISDEDDFSDFNPEYDIQIVGYFGWEEI